MCNMKRDNPAITLAGVYAADRADLTQMEDSTVTYLGILLAYGSLVLALLDTQTTRDIGPILTGMFTFVTLTLFGWYGHKINLMTIRDFGLVAMEKQSGIDPRHGQQVIELWHDPGRAKSSKAYAHILQLGNGLSGFLGFIVLCIPLYRLWQMESWLILGICIAMSIIMIAWYVKASVDLRTIVGDLDDRVVADNERNEPE